MKNGYSKKASLVLAAAAGLCCSSAALAQGSDSCAGATVVTNGTYAYDLFAATNEGNTPLACAASTASPDVWYSYTAAFAGNLVVSTCNITTGDTALSIFANDCATQLLCLDDFCGLQTEITYSMFAGETVLIRVAGYNNSLHAGSVSIVGPDGSPPPPPAPGDSCSLPGTAVDGANAFSNVGFTTDGPDECDFFAQTQINQDAWFTYTSTGTGDLTVSMCGGVTYDSKIAIYDATLGCPVSTSALACNDDFCGLQSQITVPAVTGQQFLIRIGAYGTATGTGTFNISVGEPCEITQPSGSTVEAELCGEDLNGGCNAAPESFESVPCGSSVIFGQAYADGTTRDTDWYKLTIYSDATISASITADFAAQLLLISGGCAAAVIDQAATTVNGCETASVSAFYPAGTYYIWAGPAGFAGNDCSSGNNEYVLEISTDGGCTPTGACCLTTSCSIMTQADCASSGGSYIGDDTVCENPGSYAIVDSANAFEDIAGIGFEIVQADDTTLNVPIGFAFDFYGTTYFDAWVCSNGFVQFGAVGDVNYVNGAIPSGAIPNNAAYALWTDLNFNDDPGAKCYYATLGTAGVDLRFIAQWSNVPQIGLGGTSFNTFQAILWENGTVEYRYGAVDGFAFGDVTIGVENANGTAASSIDGSEIFTGFVAKSATYTPGSSNCTGGGCPWETFGCTADQDGDDDVDSDDIVAFFGNFENGEVCGDQDGDEDVDSDDIVIFFGLFEQGGC